MSWPVGPIAIFAASFLLLLLRLLLHRVRVLPLPSRMRIAAGWMTKREKDPLLGRERSGPMKPAYLGESMPNLPSRAKKGSYNVAK